MFGVTIKSVSIGVVNVTLRVTVIIDSQIYISKRVTNYISIKRHPDQIIDFKLNLEKLEKLEKLFLYFWASLYSKLFWEGLYKSVKNLQQKG